MRRDRARFIPLAAAGAAAALALAACGTGSAGPSSGVSAAGHPITVGISIPLSGEFLQDGIATEHGYQLWASDVNHNGGLLGRPVKLVLMNNKSDQNLIAKQYRELIQDDHVDLTLAPFSTLLTVFAAQVTQKLGYVLVGGSSTGPKVFALNDPLYFSSSVPDVEELTPFANWVKSLPAGQRPRTAAYPQVDDPFADPPVQATQAALQTAGIRTVYSNSKNPANPVGNNLTRVADAVAQKNPDMVVVGSVDVPSMAAFVHAWMAVNYTPKILIAASGPDQGQAFLNAVGRNNAQDIMVPNGWYAQAANALNHVMVQDYIEKFGGTVSDINADVGEAYSAGEVLAAGVTGTHGTDNAAIARYLHTHVVQTVQGPEIFNQQGENLKAPNQAFIFQWQNGNFFQVLPSSPVSTQIQASKPRWVG
jgi:branched-chain amino acid transport system substrate-binding protein